MDAGSSSKTIRELIIAMAVVAIVVGAVAITLLYRAAYHEALVQMQTSASTVANLIEAVARFDQRFSSAHPQGSWGATMSQIEEGILLQKKEGADWEVLVGRRIGDEMQVLRAIPGEGLKEERRLPFDGSLAQPLQRALAGIRGSDELTDYEGRTVLAGYAPVPALGLGVVYKVDIGFVRAPFIRAGLWAAAVCAVLVAVGALMLTRLAGPLRRRMEQSERRLQALIACAPVGVFETDRAGRCTFVNERWCELAGLPMREALGEGWSRALHPEDAPRVGAAWKALVERHEQFAVEYRFRRRDDSVCWLHGEANAIRDEHGSVCGYSGTITDMTERKRAEAELRDSEERYRTLVEWSPDAAIVHRGGKVIFVNPAAVKLFGAGSARELIGESVFDLVHPDFRQFAMERVRRVVERSGSEPMVEVKLLKLDGTAIDVEVHGGAIVYDGQPAVFTAVRDVTERARLEEKVRRSQEHLASLIDSIDGVVWEADAETFRFVFVSAQAERLLGYPISRWIDEPDFWADRIHPDDRERVVADRIEATQAKRDHQFVYRMVAADGRAVWVRDNVTVAVRDGRPVTRRGIMVDITEQKLSEAKARATRNQLAATLDAIPDLLFELAADGAIRDYHSPRTDLLYVAPEQFLGRKIADILPAEAAAVIMEALQEADDRGRSLGRQYQLPLPQGLRWFELSVARKPWASGQERTFIALARDITERKYAEAELIRHREHLEDLVRERTVDLEKAKEEAERASRAKSEFLSRMSHELRTPMNAILGFAQVLEMEHSLVEEHRRYVEEIHRAGDHLLELINELLDMVRIEAGKLAMLVQATEVPPLVRQAVQIVLPLAAQQQIRLREQCDGAGSVLADATRMRQILVNLISNAVKYNRPGGSVDVEFRPQPGGRLRICVADTGPGIAPERQARLFKPFERLGAEFGGIDGVGIGLSLSRQLAELMGGQLGVESIVGQGSTFWLELPSAAAVAVAEERSSAEAAATNAQLRVLYVEDNVTNLRLVEAMFQCRPRLQLLSATNGEYGLELARRLKPDVILLDIHLSGMDGYGVLAALQGREDTRDIPVIALSADAMPVDVETGLKAGFRHYLTKPVKVDELIAVVESVVVGRQPVA